MSGVEQVRVFPNNIAPPTLRFTSADVERAADSWSFNCGPGALCAALQLTPNEARSHFGDFERKGYTNPTLMYAALKSLGVKYTVHQAPLGECSLPWPRLGLVRIQWSGPWTKPGVPIGARYRKTHWVASWTRDSAKPNAVYDVNLPNWVKFSDWQSTLVPWLLEECVPRADGQWWATHSIEVSHG